ncbi:unnamed protein product [Sympodiomycopsis kandeliae]
MATANTFNTSEAQDFLSLRWSAAQNGNPNVYQPSASTTTTTTSTPAVKKTAWADAAKSNNVATAASSSFAAKLVKAAGEKRGTGI